MSGGFEPWHTSSGGGGSGVTGFATIGSSPAAAGASVSGSTATLQPADATHGGVIAASGAQTLNATITLAQPLTLGTTASAGFNSSLICTDASATQFDSTASSYTQWNYKGQYVFFDSNAAVETMHLLGAAARFGANVGFLFPTALAPSGTTQTVDWNTGTSQTINAASTTGTLVLTFSNPVSGGRYILKTLGKTGRVWTMPTSLWAGGVKPTVTAVDGAIDVFQFIYDGTNYIGSIIAQNVS